MTRTRQCLRLWCSLYQKLTQNRTRQHTITIKENQKYFAENITKNWQ